MLLPLSLRPGVWPALSLTALSSHSSPLQHSLTGARPLVGSAGPDLWCAPDASTDTAARGQAVHLSHQHIPTTWHSLRTSQEIKEQIELTDERARKWCYKGKKIEQSFNQKNLWMKRRDREGRESLRRWEDLAPPRRDGEAKPHTGPQTSSAGGGVRRGGSRDPKTGGKGQRQRLRPKPGPALR